MLSKESEKFLREFRMELMTRVKDEEEIDALEEELRDHLIEAEADGKTLDDVTNGSVDNYIDAISKEVSFDKNISSMIIKIALGLFFLFTIPGLLTGTFEFTVSHVIYLVLLFVLAPLAMIALLKNIIVEHTDFVRGTIDRTGYVIIIVASVVYMGILVGAIFLHRAFPIYEFLSLDVSTTRLVGYIALGVAVIAFGLMKEWILLGALLVVSLPNIVAILFTDGNPQNDTFMIITMIGLFVMWVIFLAIMLLTYKKKKVEE